MNMTIKMAIFFFCTQLLVGCVKSPTDPDKVTAIDWSRTSVLTLDAVAMASSSDTRAGEGELMASGKTFRLYAINPQDKAIIATRTYTIDAATAGKPIVDGDATDALLLPYGTVDIFLVGPVNATLGTTTYEIATPTEVNPRVGVDLISSRTRVFISKPSTPITAAPLKHRMVKFEFEVSMFKDVDAIRATYMNATLANEKHYVSIENMGAVGVFTFDDNGGMVTSTSTTTYSYTYKEGNSGDRKVVQTDPGVEVVGGEKTGAVYTVKEYMLPTPKPTTPLMSVLFGYSLRKEDGKAGVDKEVESHLLSGKTKDPIAWTSGTSVKMTTTLIPSVDMTIRTDILEWIDADTVSAEAKADEKLIFWYSGEDGPETIDGKLCWRDRSGNGNHAQIIGKMAYDRVNKCYYAEEKGVYFKVPKLGGIGAYTLELAVQTRHSAQNRVVNFGGDAGISINLPLIGAINWKSSNDPTHFVALDCGLDKYIYNQIRSYAFARWYSGGYGFIINGKAMSSVGAAFPSAPAILDGDNQLWSGTVDTNAPERAGVGTHRIYGARMYSGNLNDVEGRKILAKNHAALLSRVGVTAQLTETDFDYVKDGLILDLRGTTAPTGSPQVWKDLSGKGNDATASSSITHNASKKCYTGGLTFAKSLGTYKDLTIEFVGRFSGTQSGGHLLIQFKPRKYMSDDYLYRTSIYYLDFVRGFLWEAPYAPHKDTHGDDLRVLIPTAELKYTVDILSQFSCTRKGAKLYVNHNGYSYTSFVKDVSPIAESELSNGYMGNSNMEIYAVRIYGRTLSDLERQHNYVVDKQKYNILP